MNIPFNKPHSTGNELTYISEAIISCQTSGNGPFTKKCQQYLSSEFGLDNTFLTSSCTDALEMSAILADIKPGDEVIVPSYTFVSTALAFARQGAKIVFADSRSENPCIDEIRIEALITDRTKAIVPVHYNGIACDMDEIMKLGEKYNLVVIEDGAHAFKSKYKGRLIGTIGHLGCFSFHETKVIHCGEGGMLSVNDERFRKRAEIILEKGTNRSDFQRKLVSKYEWIDTGSSFLMSDITAAFLLAQMEAADDIIVNRKRQWHLYYSLLKELEAVNQIRLPNIPAYSEINYSGFFICTNTKTESENLRKWLTDCGIQAISHYLDLALSPYILETQPTNEKICNQNSIRYQDTLIRLPFFHELSDYSIIEISEKIKEYFSHD